MSEQFENQDAVETTESNIPVANPFADESWIDTSVNADDSGVDTNQQTQTNYEPEDSYQTSSSNDDYEDVVDADEYLRNNLGFNNWEEAKEEIEKLRSSSTVKYDNEVSERIHKALLEGKHDEVYSYLEQTSKLNKLLTSDVDDISAEEIVKLSMRSKYPELTDSEVEFKYKKQFSLPKEPVQKYDETDEEFDQRKEDWQERVNDVKMELMIEAKSSRNQLKQLQSEIKLPEVSSGNGVNLTQEELQSVQQYVSSYMGSVDNHVNDFDGFGIEYRDEDASISSAYSPSFEEKQSISNQLKYFAQNDFNANMLLADRWVNDDGNLNMNQVIQDLSLLQNSDKIIQKLVNDSVAKRLHEYRKSTSNIRVGSQSSGTFSPNNNQSDQAKMAEFFFGI
jgi:hypothetical protein